MVIGLLSVFLGALGAFMVSRFGCRLGLIDRPNLRSSHSRATPKGAGVGLLMAFVLVGIPSGFPSPIWLPAALLSLVSLLGDRFEISPKVRLVMQFAATGWACHWLFVRSGLISNRSRLEITCWLLFAALYLMGTANIYNFMDGINGIAGITGIVAFGILAGVGWARGERPEWILVALAIAAACGGFLPWNFPRARVFMGDVGSVLLGLMFAVFAVCWSQNPADFLMLAAFLFPFYADELVTLWTRI